MFKNSMNKGFTLLELLVAILIISILVAIAVPQYMKAVERAKYAEVEEQLSAIAQAQQRYANEHGEYAEDFQDLDIEFLEEENP
ncbi:MAG: prepilin-type N-terminal cleavage/methylation domain-containing protein [Elusimicrobiaceae bacterium]|nr:prepilin-type N-terminal cleavage/methylation domain-containing protein [Elusimicrobiaceae bacterium]